MKLSRIAVLAISAMCLAPCAHAEQQGVVHAQVKAIVDYCSRIDPQHRNDYDTFGAKVMAGITDAGSSADYRAAYDAASDALEKTPREQARMNCTAGIGLPRAEHDRDHDDR